MPLIFSTSLSKRLASPRNLFGMRFMFLSKIQSLNQVLSSSCQ
jgi:hypothetical protein